MEKIVPYFWLDNEATEAVEFYMSLFEDSEILVVQELEDTPSGESGRKGYDFTLHGQPFGAFDGGPFFKINPSISLMVMCDTKEEVQKLWNQFIDGGKEILPLKAHYFSELYGWVEDRYGLTWQLISAEDMKYKQKILPYLLFSGDVSGKAKEAMAFYTEVFQGGKILDVNEYGENQASLPEAQIAHATFEIMDMEIAVADTGDDKYSYPFNEAVSLMVKCVTQAEIDYYWEKLSADSEAEQCGWLKDKYGVSWQIAPHNLSELLSTGTREQINAVTQTFLPMKKLDKEKLERAWAAAAE